MQAVGITGGIGAGKSIVSDIIKSMGFPVFNSDIAAKEIMHSDKSVRQALISWFGDDIYSQGGLNRQLLAHYIFTDNNNRLKVNNLVHPKVREAFENLCDATSADLVFNEAAILIETGAYKNFDKLLLVTAPEPLRIERVLRRDHASKEEVQARISKQYSDTEKRPFASVEIVNDEVTPLLSQVEQAIEVLRTK